MLTEIRKPLHSAFRFMAKLGWLFMLANSESNSWVVPYSHTLLRRRWLSGCGLIACVVGLGPAGARTVGAIEPAPKWPIEISSGAFRIHADAELERQKETIAELNRLSDDVVEMLRIERPQSTVHIVLFGSADEYHRYLQHYFPTVPNRRALFIQQRGTPMLFAYQHADMATDLRHETVHALLNDSEGQLPLWLDEGLAEYFEVPRTDRWSGHAHLTTLRENVDSPVLSLDQLEQLDDVAQMTGEHYRHSWAWVHFLLHRRKNIRQMLLQQLAELRIGQPVPPLSRTIARVIPGWQSEIAEHFRAIA